MTVHPPVRAVHGAREHASRVRLRCVRATAGGGEHLPTFTKGGLLRTTQLWT